MAGDIDHFADEKQSFDVRALHGLARKFGGVHAASGHFCLFVAFRVCRFDHPVVYLLLPFCEGFIVPRGRGMVFQLAFGESPGQNSLKGLLRRCTIA